MMARCAHQAWRPLSLALCAVRITVDHSSHVATAFSNLERHAASLHLTAVLSA